MRAARGFSRRRWLAAALGLAAGAGHGQPRAPALAGGVVGSPGAAGAPASPGPAHGDAAHAIDAVLRGRTATPGRVHLEIPKLAENGLSVPFAVRVDSPMTDADHVRTVHLFAPANPIPTVARLHFGPRSGEARFATRIRLADSQRVVALAEMSDGSVWRGDADVVVTLGGCLDPIL